MAINTERDYENASFKEMVEYVATDALKQRTYTNKDYHSKPYPGTILEEAMKDFQ